MRQTDGFGEFEEIDTRKPHRVVQKKPAEKLAKPSKNILYGDDSFGEFGTGLNNDKNTKSRRKITENKYYKGSDSEDG